MTNIKIIAMILLFSSVFSLFACGSVVSPLEDTTWVLESYYHSECGHFHSVLEDTKITASFDSNNGQVTGSGGCNHYFAGYEIHKNEISIIGPIGATEMYCSEAGVMDQEKQYFSLLETIETFYINKGKLTILNSVNPILVFVTQ